MEVSECNESVCLQKNYNVSFVIHIRVVIKSTSSSIHKKTLKSARGFLHQNSAMSESHQTTRSVTA